MFIRTPSDQFGIVIMIITKLFAYFHYSNQLSNMYNYKFLNLKEK